MSSMKLGFAILLSLLFFGCAGIQTNGAEPPAASAETGTAPGPEPTGPETVEAQPESTGEAEPPAPEVVIERTFSFVSGINYYYITGIIKNNGAAPVKFVRAQVTYYKKDGTRITSKAIPYPARLAPGETTAFILGVNQAVSGEMEAGRYEVIATDFIVDDAIVYAGLTAVVDSVEDIGGFYKVRGRVINSGGEPSPPYSANAIFYDKDGNVLTVAFDPKLVGLEPGDEEIVSYFVPHPGNGHIIAGQEIKIDVRY